MKDHYLGVKYLLNYDPKVPGDEDHPSLGQPRAVPAPGGMVYVVVPLVQIQSYILMST